MRRLAPVAIGVAIAALLVSYVLYTQGVVRELRRESSHTAAILARIYQAQTDTTADAPTTALYDLARMINEMGVPVVVTDRDGAPTAYQNLPFDPGDSARLAAYIRELDRRNAPVETAGTAGTIHYGDTPIVSWLAIIPIVQTVILILALGAGIALLRARSRAERERVWAGMARESAHQLGTPLSSLNGWIELLSENASDGRTAASITHMRGDLERLERVAHRFERIGRPPRREPVDIGALVERVASYFRARVPTLAHTVRIESRRSDAPLIVEGDSVLLEWAVEAIVKNAVDALAGRGGTVQIEVEPAPEQGVRIRVADDGPGVPRQLRRRIFQPGFSTKNAGWGIGLSLARRIVERVHGGHLSHVAEAEPGATFDIILR